MYDRILLPTDMSRGVDRAVSHAIDAAQRYDATLDVLYVVDIDTYRSYPGDEYVHEFEGLESALQRAGEEAVEGIVTQAEEAGVPTQAVITHGVPHEEILRYAREVDSGMIILGSKQRESEYRALLGSVAQRVASLADRPVTIVKSPVEKA